MEQIKSQVINLSLRQIPATSHLAVIQMKSTSFPKTNGWFAHAVYLLILLYFCLEGSSMLLLANIPGGGSGTGANVTLVDNNNGTVTLDNGIVSLLINKTSANITQINYTYNNGSGNTTTQLLSGGHNGGQMYWSWTPSAGQQGPNGTYSIITDPASNGGNFAEVSIYTTWGGNASLGWADVDVHYSMLRGSTGFYATAIHIRKNTYAASTMAEWRSNIYVGSMFNWINVNPVKTLAMASPNASFIAVPGAPAEVSLWTSGLYQGHYEDKYCYSDDLGDLNAYGWTSVGSGGKNVGIWITLPSHEYYNGGPMKRELLLHQGPTELNMLNGTHYGMGQDYVFNANETWTKVFGPYFVYCNNVANSITDATAATAALNSDAQSQAAAEQGAWPYSWFTNSNYVHASGRGTVTGKIAISDTYNPNASVAGLWVGVEQTPVNTATYDFQQWCKTYQYWVKTGTDGSFTIPNVIAGSNYTLFAFGPGAAGTYQSRSLTASFSYFELNIPSSQFSVTVTAGATTNLGTVTWTPIHVGPTVFEIGVPDRNATEFRHGDDYWKGDIGPSPTTPSPIWGKHLEYPYDFPSDVAYTVGTSKWSTDWNWVQPCVADSSGNFTKTSSSTISFYLPTAPTQPGSLYIGLAADVAGPLKVQINGTDIAGSNGYSPSVFSSSNDAVVRQGIHGAFADNRFSVAANLLHSGTNTITLIMRKAGSGTNGATYDYLRLEEPGYVPPAPASAMVVAGNSQVLVQWPLVSGATGYNVKRSLVSGTSYAAIASSVQAPVTGSGPSYGTYLDTTATNGTTYYYVVSAVNTIGESANSAQATTAASAIAPATPSAPTGLNATPGNGSIALAWNASAGASTYTVQRSVFSGGAYTTLTNHVTGTTFTDNTTTNGTTYFYVVSGANASGSSGNSAEVGSKSTQSAPTASPGNVIATPDANQISLAWSAASGATGYLIQRSTTSGGPYSLISSWTGTKFTNTGLGNNTTYYYTITAVNAGGTGPSSTQASATTAPAPPTGLSVTAGNTQATLSWTAATGATSYVIQRSTTSGAEATFASGVVGTTYTNNSLTNGTTYYYVIDSTNANGTGPDSSEVSVTPTSSVPVAPTGLTATAGNAQVVLGWTASAGAINYTVKRAAANGGPYTNLTTTATGTTYTHTPATNGTTYYYVLAATGTGGTGANSAQVSATPLAPPPAPTNLTATGSNAQVILNWNAAAGATGYILKRGTASGQETTTVSSNISTTTFTNTGLTNGTTYYFVVSGSNASGTSGNSNEASARPAQTYSQWIAAAFPGQSDPLIIGNNADPDDDGVPNLIEYFTGTNPAAKDAAPLACALDGQGNVVLTFRMARNLTGVTYSIDQSTDLSNWSSTGLQGIPTDMGSYYLMKVTIPINTGSKLLRLSVTP